MAHLDVRPTPADEALDRAGLMQTVLVSEPGDTAVQVVLVGALDFGGDDLADP